MAADEIDDVAFDRAGQDPVLQAIDEAAFWIDADDCAHCASPIESGVTGPLCRRCRRLSDVAQHHRERAEAYEALQEKHGLLTEPAAPAKRRAS